MPEHCAQAELTAEGRLIGGRGFGPSPPFFFVYLRFIFSPKSYPMDSQQDDSKMSNRFIKRRNGELVELDISRPYDWLKWADRGLEKTNIEEVLRILLERFVDGWTVDDINKEIIRICLDQGTYNYQLMAGRFYATELHRKVLGDLARSDRKYLTLKGAHDRMIERGLMITLPYTDEEYAYLETVLDHSVDFTYPHFQLKQLASKYAISDKVTGELYETPQLVHMRTAMASCVNDRDEVRLQRVKDSYVASAVECSYNQPTPFMVALGTPHEYTASCCTFEAADNGVSLAVASHVTTMQTLMSSGVGSLLDTRSLGDPVRGGVIQHAGHRNYLVQHAGDVNSNMQNGRTGAANSMWRVYDPDSSLLLEFTDPQAPLDKRLPIGIDLTMQVNNTFNRRVMEDGEITVWNSHTAPELDKAFYGKDCALFDRLYAQYEQNNPDAKRVRARDLAGRRLNAAFMNGRYFRMNVTNVNSHTPLKEMIRDTNLCTEVMQVTAPFYVMEQLYHDGSDLTLDEYEVTYLKIDPRTGKETTAVEREMFKVGDMFVNRRARIRGESVLNFVRTKEDSRSPEVSLCNLGAIVCNRARDVDHHIHLAEIALRKVDYAIDNCKHMLPYVGYTSRQRRYAGIGLSNFAHFLAQKGLKYTDPESLIEAHKLAERHAYACIMASLNISKERGVAPWMHKTRWPEGWTPLKTYNHNVDIEFERITGVHPDSILQFDWDMVSQMIVANGGIAHSLLIAHMPGESSSKASNTIGYNYPVEAIALMKADGKRSIEWVAPESDTLEYQCAYEVPRRTMILHNAIMQKFADQATSYDGYEMTGGKPIDVNELISDELYGDWLGQKSSYYIRQRNVSSGADTKVQATAIRAESACSAAGGGCSN